MKVRLAVLAILVVFALPPLAAEDDSRSIVFLFDLSYSMSLEIATGESRLAAAQRAAADIVAATAGRATWTVLGFEDVGDLVGERVPTADPAAALERIDSLLTWGRSPVSDALAQTVDAVDGPAVLIVLSDLLESEPPRIDGMASSTISDAARAKGVAVHFLVDQADSPAAAVGWAARIAEASGGTLRPLDEYRRLVGPLLGEAHVQSDSDTGQYERDAEKLPATPPATAAVADPSRDTHEGVPERMRAHAELDRSHSRSGTVILSWLLVAAAVAAGGYTTRLFLRWRSATRLVEQTPPRPVFALSIVDSDRNRARHTLDRFPVTIGNGAGCTVRLGSPFPGRSGRSPNIRIDRESARAVFSSNALLNVNGAGKRRKVLNSGDRIRYGRYTIEFEGLDWERPSAPPPKRHLRFASLPIAAAALALFFRIDAMESAVAFDVAPPPAAPSEDFGRGDEAESTFSDTRDIAQPPAGGARMAAASETRGDRLPWNPDARASTSLPETVIYPEVDGSVDILFVHAHPDDEALDYGALAAAADAAGKRAGLILFTDGNAGLDQYPWRGVDTEYPQRRLRDAELSAVRVREAQRAMARLGIDLYVRLGLPNHPYSGIDEELSVSEVTTRWGGTARLSGLLARLIRTLSPTVLVSPDGESEAYEHFEHEAVGEVTMAALRLLGNESPIRVHLTPVDPLQTGAYEDERAFDAWEMSTTGTRYRDIQLAALREHRTQRDASVIGIEVRQGLRYEHYRIGTWRSGSPPETSSLRELLDAAFETAPPSARDVAVGRDPSG